MKRFPIVAGVLLVSAIAAGALDLGRGVTLVSSGTDQNDRTVASLKDAAGRAWSISYVEDPTPSLIDRISRLKDQFYAFKNVKIDSLQFAVTGSLINATILPSRFVSGGQDLTAYLPAGLFFSYSDALEYDFRVAVESLFLRINGPFTGEDEIVKKVSAAVADPKKFLVRSDPEYILSRFDQYDKSLVDLRAANDQLRAADDELRAADDKLRADNQALKDELTRVRTAAMTNQNQVFFSKKPVPPDGVARVTELKQADPSLTVAQVSTKLKAEGIKMTDREIKLVFQYYFNEGF